MPRPSVRDLSRLRRAAAVLAGASVAAHLLMLGRGSASAGLLMAGMAALCLPCAVHLWRSAALRAWAAVGAMNAGMLIVHSSMMRAAAGGHAAGERPSAGVEADSGAGSHGLPAAHELLMLLATALSGAEVVLAGVGLALGATRRRRTRPHLRRAGPVAGL